MACAAPDMEKILSLISQIGNRLFSASCDKSITSAVPPAARRNPPLRGYRGLYSKPFCEVPGFPQADIFSDVCANKLIADLSLGHVQISIAIRRRLLKRVSR